MMVTGLQLPSQSLPPDGMFAKSQPMDSETIQPLSFGEILKAKEEQLQKEQEVSASSMVAALITLQTPSIAPALPVPEIEASNILEKVDTQAAVQTNASESVFSQISAPASTNGSVQASFNTIVKADQVVSHRSLPTELPSSVSDEPQTILSQSLETPMQSASVDSSQLPVTKFSESNTTILSLDQDTEKQSLQKASQHAANVDATPNHFPLEIPSEQTVVPEAVEPGIRTTGSDFEIPNLMTSIGSKVKKLAMPLSPQMSESAKVTTASLADHSLSLDMTDQSGKSENVVMTTVEISSETSIPEFSTSKDLGETLVDSLQPEKSEDKDVSKEEVAHTIPTRSLLMQAEFEQKTVPSLSQSAEKSKNTSVRSFESSSEKTTLPLSSRAVRNPAVTHFTLQAEESLTGTSILSDTAFAQPSRVQTSAHQGMSRFTSEQDNLIDTNASTVEAPNLPPAKPSTVQTPNTTSIQTSSPTTPETDSEKVVSQAINQTEAFTTNPVLSKNESLLDYPETNQYDPGTDESQDTLRTDERTTTPKIDVISQQNVEKPPVSDKEITSSTSSVASKRETLVFSSTSDSETLGMNMTQGMSDEQANKTLGDYELSLSLQKRQMEDPKPDQAVSQLESQLDIDDKHPAQASMQPLNADEMNIAEYFKPTEPQKSEKTAPFRESASVPVNVSESLILERTDMPSPENNGVPERTIKQFVTPSSMQFDQYTDEIGQSLQEPQFPAGKETKKNSDTTASVVGTLQTEVSLSNVIKGSSVTKTNNNVENAVPNESIFAAGTGDRQDVDFQHGETPVSRQSVLQTNVKDPNIKLVDETVSAEAQPLISNAKQVVIVDSPAFDIRNAAINTDRQDIAAGSNLAKPQTASTASYSELNSKFSPTENEILSANANPVEFQSKGSPIEEEFSNSTQSVVDTVQTRVDTHPQSVEELETNLSNADTAMPTESSKPKSEVLNDVNDSATKLTEPQLSEAEPQPAPRSANIVAAVSESSSSIAQSQVRIKQKEATSQQDITQDVSPQPKNDPLTTQAITNQKEITLESSVTVATPMETINISQTDTEIENPTATSILPADRQEVMASNTQPVESILERIETRHLEEPVNFYVDTEMSTSKEVEISQANSTDPANRVDVTCSEKDSHASTTPAQSTIPQEIHQDKLAPQPSWPFSGITEQEKNEKQVKVRAPSVEILKSDPSAGLEMGFETITDAELQERQVLSTEAEPLDEILSGSQNASKPVPSPAPDLISHSDAVVSVQPDTSIKTEAGKQTLKNKPVVSKDEEIRSTEKHAQPNQSLEATGSPTSAVKEPMNVEQNIKVATNQVNTQAADVAQQVIHQMNLKVKNAPTSMHLQLNPKELGNIDVEMVSTSQGVRVTFFAEQADTGKLLETQLSQLRESLIDSGVQLSSLNISQQGLSEQKGGFFSQDKSFTQYPQGDIPRKEVSSTEVSPAKQVTSSSGEVDYRI